MPVTLKSKQAEQRKPHPAIEYLNQLKTSSASTQLEELLSSYRGPKSMDAETFATGVKQFMALANSKHLCLLLNGQPLQLCLMSHTPISPSLRL